MSYDRATVLAAAHEAGCYEVNELDDCLNHWTFTADGLDRFYSLAFEAGRQAASLRHGLPLNSHHQPPPPWYIEKSFVRGVASYRLRREDRLDIVGRFSTFDAAKREALRQHRELGSLTAWGDSEQIAGSSEYLPADSEQMARCRGE